MTIISEIKKKTDKTYGKNPLGGKKWRNGLGFPLKKNLIIIIGTQ